MENLFLIFVKIKSINLSSQESPSGELLNEGRIIKIAANVDTIIPVGVYFIRSPTTHEVFERSFSLGTTKSHSIYRQRHAQSKSATPEAKFMNTLIYIYKCRY